MKLTNRTKDPSRATPRTVTKVAVRDDGAIDFTDGDGWTVRMTLAVHDRAALMAALVGPLGPNDLDGLSTRDGREACVEDLQECYQIGHTLATVQRARAERDGLRITEFDLGDQ